jgi:hypothetical protein
MWNYNAMTDKTSQGNILLIATEQRWSARKVLKARAILTMSGSEPVITRTTDVGGEGMSITLPHPVGLGMLGSIRFDMFFGGKASPITAKVKVAYCIFSSGEFKVGFKFVSLDMAAMALIAKYIG